jgi:hypothetical protein
MNRGHILLLIAILILSPIYAQVFQVVFGLSKKTLQVFAICPTHLVLLTTGSSRKVEIFLNAINRWYNALVLMNLVSYKM